MFKSLAFACVALTFGGGAWADDGPKQTPGTLGLTADGTWDCYDPGGAYLGAVVIADLSYAFVGPDRKVGTYGKLNKDDWVDVPAFFVLSGALKDSFGAIGMSVSGPEASPEDVADWSKNRLKVVITAEQLFYCAARRGPMG